MIPANSAIDSLLKSVRPGNLIDLREYLVLAEGPDGWDSAGNLYGTTYYGGSGRVTFGNGVVFMLKP